jgi:uncharacterized protein YndB with AHSA1/START domain
MKHTPPATEPIVFECDLPHSPALVWRALTDRDLLGAWLLPNDMRPEVSARFSFERADQQPGYSIECEVLEVEPNRTLQWRQTEAGDPESGWRSVTSVVTIELTDNAAGGTHLRVVPGNGGSWITCTPLARAGSNRSLLSSVRVSLDQAFAYDAVLDVA